MSIAAQTTPNPKAAVPGRKTILVVEDDNEVRDLETFLLSAEGYQVVGVPDGTTAAMTARDEKADLVILDLMLPTKSGNEVLAELQRDPQTAQTPVIVVSAYVRDLRRTSQVRRVIQKPFDIPDLLDAVARELEHRASE